jgi:phage gpG-like protein
MRLQIKGLAELQARLERVRVEEIMAKALAEQAERMAQAVREALSDPPGAGPHDKPWQQTGALHDSITATANGLEAAVGSNEQAAAPQELGTAHLPPRPFLAPIAAMMGPDVARAVAAAVAAAIKGNASLASGNPLSQAGPIAASDVQPESAHVHGPIPSRHAKQRTKAVSPSAQSALPAPSPSVLLVGDWTRSIDNTTAGALRMSRSDLRKAIHSLKDHAGLRGDDDVVIHIPTGNVYFGDEVIGHLHDE